jgi:hypothetical protein
MIQGRFAVLVLQRAAVAGVIFILGVKVANAWVMKKAPLMTRWSAQVDPAHPLPEYPRPQLVRELWLNLNGIWEYQPGTETDALPTGKLSSEILVPFPVESALSGVMEHHDRLWYRRTFAVPAEWQGRNVILHFGAVDFESEVFINGKSVGVHRGGYDPFSYDITPFLKSEGDQELIVRVFDPTDNAGEPRGKQTLIPHDVDYTCTTGIWQTVWIEPVAPDGVKSLSIVPDIDSGHVKITVQTYRDMANEQVTVQVKDGATVIGTATASPSIEMSIPVPNAKLWSPDQPFLYDLSISIGPKAGAPVDTVGSYFGMRKIEVAKVDGMNRILLNGKFVFQFGALDQGFWPDGIYTAPTDDAIKNDIQVAKNFGLNLLRKQIKVEPARWYYWTDHLGMIVWQDMPSPNTYMGPNEPVEPVDKAEFESELRRMVENLRNVPSIIMWDIFNEGQGAFDYDRLAAMVKAQDPTRLVSAESGGNHAGVGDVVDSHGPPTPERTWEPSATQASVIGEFGGFGVSVPGHRWEDGKGGPIDFAQANAIIGGLERMSPMIRKLRDKHGLSGADYVQLTDVEGEQNGLLTYDRLPKFNPADLVPAIHLEVPDYKYTIVVPTSQINSQTWKYTLQDPGKDWMKKDFDDSKWQDGPGGFGIPVPNHGIVGTPWTTPHIWLRRHFNPGALSPGQLDGLGVTDYHDDDVSVYLNGVPAFAARGFQVDYENEPASPESRRALVPNADNVLAVEGDNADSGQYVDVGLSVREVAQP